MICLCIDLKESLLVMIDRKKIELDSRRPLTEGEVERLTEEFVVEYTYNSNAIEGNTLTLRETDMVLRGLTKHELFYLKWPISLLPASLSCT